MNSFAPSSHSAFFQSINKHLNFIVHISSLAFLFNSYSPPPYPTFGCVLRWLWRAHSGMIEWRKIVFKIKVGVDCVCVDPPRFIVHQTLQFSASHISLRWSKFSLKMEILLLACNISWKIAGTNVRLCVEPSEPQQNGISTRLWLVVKWKIDVCLGKNYHLERAVILSKAENLLKVHLHVPPLYTSDDAINWSQPSVWPNYAL